MQTQEIPPEVLARLVQAIYQGMRPDALQTVPKFSGTLPSGLPGIRREIGTQPGPMVYSDPISEMVTNLLGVAEEGVTPPMPRSGFENLPPEKMWDPRILGTLAAIAGVLEPGPDLPVEKIGANVAKWFAPQIEGLSKFMKGAMERIPSFNKIGSQEVGDIVVKLGDEKFAFKGYDDEGNILLEKLNSGVRWRVDPAFFGDVQRQIKQVTLGGSQTLDDVLYQIIPDKPPPGMDAETAKYFMETSKGYRHEESPFGMTVLASDPHTLRTLLENEDNNALRWWVEKLQEPWGKPLASTNANPLTRKVKGQNASLNQAIVHFSMARELATRALGGDTEAHLMLARALDIPGANAEAGTAATKQAMENINKDWLIKFIDTLDSDVSSMRAILDATLNAATGGTQ